MQFSKKVVDLAKLYNIEPKDVLFALLTTAGASMAEAFAVIHRPACSTSNALAARASQHVGARPGLRKLISELLTHADETNPANKPKKVGRPRKADNPDQATPQTPTPLDYTDKDAVLKEYAEIAATAEKVGDKLSALNGIATLQRMKQEAKVEEEKRVVFYIPLPNSRYAELLDKLGELTKSGGEYTESQADTSNLPE